MSYLGKARTEKKHTLKEEIPMSINGSSGKNRVIREYNSWIYSYWGNQGISIEPVIQKSDRTKQCWV